MSSILFKRSLINLITMKVRLLLFILFIPIIAFAQDKNKIDSLLRIFNSDIPDSSKIRSLEHLFTEYSYTNSDSAKAIANLMLNYSKEKNFQEGIYQGYVYTATYYRSQSKLDSVIDNMNRALQVAIEMNNPTYQSNCHVRIGMAYSYMNQFDKSKQHTLKALQLARENRDWKGLYYARYRLGNTFYMESNYPEALTNYLRSDSILNVHDQVEPTLAAILSNIGSIYNELQDFDKAEDYFNKSQETYRKLDHDEGVMHINIMMGMLESNRLNHNKAIELFETALEFYTRIHNEREMANIVSRIAISQTELKKYEEAKVNYLKAIDLATKTKSTYEEVNSYAGLGKVYRNLHQPDLAINNLTKALELYDELHMDLGKPAVIQELAMAYSEKGDYKKAFLTSQKYLSLKDSLDKANNAGFVQELETKYQTEKKENEIALLTAQNQLKEQEKIIQRNRFYIFGAISILIVIFLYILYRNRQKTATGLKKLDAFKSRFFANISHEFRTPLTLIGGPLEKQLNNGAMTSEDRQDFELIQRNSLRLQELVDQLLDLSKLESGNFQLKVSEHHELSELIQSIFSSFQYQVKRKNIYAEIEADNILDAWYDRDVVEKIATNLISNAFKYTPQEGFVRVECKNRQNEFHLMVENSGGDLTKEKIEKIFDRFYQADEHAEGAGIGLSLVKELVTISHGKINVESRENGNILFHVILPIDKNSYHESEIDETSIHKSKISPTTVYPVDTKETHIDAENDQPILLIIEDNKDIRSFIGKSLKNTYQILESEDGEGGVKTAMKYIPDIILSDVMMPGMSGLEVCQTLKTDEKTCHIPLVILTAKVEDEDQLKGLETGADDYITKPFKIQLLEKRLKNLIQNRKKLRERYSQEIILKPKDIAIVPRDEQFLIRLQLLLDDKLTYPDFNAEYFSREMGMSRMQLHRKIKALTGLSTTEFVRSQRLKAAVVLLTNSDINVSEVGYTVGFNDPSYFIKCFKESYGKTPAVFANEMKSNK